MKKIITLLFTMVLCCCNNCATSNNVMDNPKPCNVSKEVQKNCDKICNDFMIRKMNANCKSYGRFGRLTGNKISGCICMCDFNCPE